MEHILTFQEFLARLNKKKDAQDLAIMKQRFQELAGLKDPQIFKNIYAIQITIYTPKGVVLLKEHEKYTKFQKTTNRYAYHPANPAIPVNAHYHIYPPNSKKEAYAVNVDDGKAHHKKNRGHLIPKKEAEELRALGVKIPKNNILESKQLIINENNSANYFTTFIIINEEE